MVARTSEGTNARTRSHTLRARGLEEIREQAATVKQDAREFASTLKSVARKQLDPIREYIAKKPMQAMLIAGGVGALLGVFWRHRR